MTLLALTIMFVLGVGVAAPASAAELTLKDARGDVWRHDEAGTASQAPNVRLGDVTRATIRHVRRHIVVTTRYVELARTGRYANYTIRLQDRQRHVREVVVEAGPRSWPGKARVFGGNGSIVRSCHVRHHIDYSANVVRVVVPRTCIGDGGAVRANLNDYRANANDDFFSDTPQNDRDHASAWTAWINAH
jgi:hypothetical protein